MRFYEIPYTDEYSFYYKQSPDYYTACDEIGAILTGDYDSVNLDIVLAHLKTLLILVLLLKGDD